MPNVKIFVDETVWKTHKADLSEALLPIRNLLCKQLNVPVAACQLALIPFSGLNDQPLVNMELMILHKPERAQEIIRALCSELQTMLRDITGVRVAVRAAALDPATYIAMK